MKLSFSNLELKKETISTNTIPPVPFIFVRHGNTDWKIDNIISGEGNLVLNQQGIHQAKTTAATLQAYPKGYLVSSPLKRTTQTAEIIADGNEISLINSICARNYGDFSKDPKLAEVIMNKLKRGSFELNDNDLPEEAETLAEFTNRVKQGFSEILANNTSTDIAIIVSHSEVFEALLTLLNVNNSIGWIRKGDAILFTPPSIENDLWQIERL